MKVFPVVGNRPQSGMAAPVSAAPREPGAERRLRAEMKVFSVVGNRPQFVKSAPVSAALRERGLEEVVLHTGQHWDREMSQVFFDELGLAEPAYRLDARSRELDAMLPG